jgi:hypothetical protein
VKISFLEIYNEIVKDMLVEDVAAAKELKVSTHGAVGLTEHEADCLDKAAELLALGAANRKTSATRMNAQR